MTASVTVRKNRDGSITMRSRGKNAPDLRKVVPVVMGSLDSLEAGEPEELLAAAAQASPGHRMASKRRTSAQRAADHAPNLFVSVREKMELEALLRAQLAQLKKSHSGKLTQRRIVALLDRLAAVRWG